MRIHLGHHFYGAGNLGDDFMLAGFLAAMGSLAPQASFTCCVPFPLDPLRQRFPGVGWHPYDEASRDRCIADCDVWLGLGGSPFQHALSRWFVDHLEGDAARCERRSKPMFFLGVGVQTSDELRDVAVQRVCAQALAIWTRDVPSAERLAALSLRTRVESSTDLAHLFFRAVLPPAAQAGRLTFVGNFDYAGWPGQETFLRLTGQAASPFSKAISDRVWLAQESRDLPGAERALYAALPAEDRARWRLVIPDLDPTPVASLESALARWPSGEWLVTARFHAALCGAVSGSKIVIIGTNEKLRGVARDLDCPVLPVDADEAAVLQALRLADGRPSLFAHVRAADRAHSACAEFVRAATRSAVAPRHENP